ncbi:MAG: MBL fold metallo-hydrolase [Phycisphaerales bacterium]|nr:MAG: MBL fold metallo-hydrolase [Phycisphaerales bacterium]
MARDLRFTLLGTGTSSGVPVVGCDCPTCTSDDPRDRRLRCSGCLQFTDADGQERVILLDTSPDLRQQALRLKLHRCDAIFHTHDHVDHTFGLDEVRRFNVLMDAHIEVFADERTMRSLHRIFDHIFNRERNSKHAFVAKLLPRVIDPNRPVDLYGLRFTPVKLLHGGLEVLGYRIDALDHRKQVADDQPAPLPLAYCTDVSAIPPESWAKLTGLRTLVLDMLRYRNHPMHFSLDGAVAAAERIAAGQTWFIHMTHDVLHADLDSKLPDRVSLAYDGLVIGEG